MLPDYCKDCVNVRRGKCIMGMQDAAQLGICFGKALNAKAAAKKLDQLLDK